MITWWWSHDPIPLPVTQYPSFAPLPATTPALPHPTPCPTPTQPLNCMEYWMRELWQNECLSGEGCITCRVLLQVWDGEGISRKYWLILDILVWSMWLLWLPSMWSWLHFTMQAIKVFVQDNLFTGDKHQWLPSVKS